MDVRVAGATDLHLNDPVLIKGRAVHQGQLIDRFQSCAVGDGVHLSGALTAMTTRVERRSAIELSHLEGHSGRRRRPLIPLQDCIDLGRCARTARLDEHDVVLELALALVVGTTDVNEAVVIGISQSAAPVILAVVASGLYPEDAGRTSFLHRRRGGVRVSGAVAAAVTREAERAVHDLDTGALNRGLGHFKPDVRPCAVEVKLCTRRHLVHYLGNRRPVFGRVRARRVVPVGAVLVR